jgi:hypothetical protein
MDAREVAKELKREGWYAFESNACEQRRVPESHSVPYRWVTPELLG